MSNKLKSSQALHRAAQHVHFDLPAAVADHPVIPHMSENVRKCPVSPEISSAQDDPDPPAFPNPPPDDPPFPSPRTRGEGQGEGPARGANHLDSLTDRHITAITLLLIGHKPTTVANALGLNPRTLHRWRTQNPAFREELARRRDELLADTTGRLCELLGASLDALQNQLFADHPPTARSAAKTLLVLAQVPQRLAPPPSPTPMGGADE